MRKQLVTPIILAMTLTASAAIVSPERALEAAIATSGARHITSTGTSGYTLAYTTENSRLYIFNNSRGGFIVAAGDDEMPALLGYTDNGAFDPDNIPPGMNDLLKVMASRGVKRSTPKTNRENINRIVTCTWNQDSPFNNDCPEVNGEKCMTGCMATAIAQVMYSWKQPAKGKGSKTYYWESGGRELSFNYDQNPWDWNNMIDSYASNGGTAVQRAAVANLMYSVGVAINMMYGPTASGAYDSDAGAGMVNYLGYDPSLRLMQHDSMSDDAWDNLIYNQLATGHPIVYTGLSQAGGHAFVCDGYNASDGFYHINWGWGGMCDGFYPLNNLEPDEQGIGGGVGSFSNMMSAFIGIKPNEGGTHTPVVFYDGEFYPSPTQVAPSGTVAFYTSAQNYCFFNLDYPTLTAVFGVKLVDCVTGETSYVSMSSASTAKPYDYFAPNRLSAPASAFPTNGQYIVSPAIQVDNVWSDVSAYDSRNRKYIKMTAENGNLTFNYSTEKARLQAFAVESDQATIQVNTSGESGNVSITADIQAIINNFSGDIYILAIDSDNETVCAINGGNIYIAAEETEQFSTTVSYTGLMPDKNYTFVLATRSGNYYLPFSTPVKFSTVRENKPQLTTGPIKINGTSLETDKPVDIILDDNMTLSVDVSCSFVDFQGTAAFVSNSNEIYSAPFTIYAGNSEIFAASVSGRKFTTGENAITFTAGDFSTEPYKVNFIDNTGGIGNITADTDDTPQYYTLQGIRVNHPAPGNVYIRVTGSRAEKIAVM